MSYKDLYNELLGTLPDLPLQQAKRFINRAQRDCYDAWNWSFLAGQGVLNVPASIATGTVTVTQNSQTIVANGAAAAVWNALGLFIPITQRALKLGTDLPYQILAYDGVDTVYIDRPYTGVTTAGLSYILYRPYYAAPDDFQRWVSVVDTVDSWNLIPGKKQEWINWIDPQRNTIGGPAQFVSFFKLQRAQTIPIFGANVSTVTTTAQNLFELWPAPTSVMSIYTYYKKRGLDMIAPEDTSPFDDGLIMSRALYHAYRFVQVNAARFASNMGTRVDWNGMYRQANSDYLYELGNAIKRDDNINRATMPLRNPGWAPSSSWLQKHLTWGEYSRAYSGSYS